ncbi:uncharacterized protein [Asterias amurensis]|uniref:uncharacterized protein n=1 Tax=Asterias amurensis TaxID=7602 RepID=UPI003AB8F693
MAVKTIFVYSVAVMVFTCVYSVYGQEATATPAPCEVYYYYHCNDGNGCYFVDDECDYRNTCADKTDDLNCDRCHFLAYHCNESRQCISTSKACDGHQDCLYGEDEDPTYCAIRCDGGAGDFRCNDYYGCYFEDDRCDSSNGCVDKTDDLNCDSCNDDDSFYCPSSRQCVSTSLVCDGNLDCLFGEDEDAPDCFPPCTGGYTGEYQCRDGEGCYSDYHRCDSYSVCGDKSDDLKCDKCTDSFSFYCPSSRQCVSKDNVCDGNRDCLNGEDEDSTDCRPLCTSSYYTGDYQCNDGNGCYSVGDKCNSHNECNDKTDELNCDDCRGFDTFYCYKSRQCVSNYEICDGQQDCLHGEDEDQPECFPTIWNYLTGGQVAGAVIGFTSFVVIVIVIVVVVHKKCQK